MSVVEVNNQRPHATRGSAGTLAVIGMAQLIIVLDGTIVAIALPQMQRALMFSSSGLQWVVNAYALTFGGTLLAAGRLADRYGRRRSLAIGLILFSVVSAVGGAAQTALWLVLARAAQGLCAALIAPAALGLLTTTFVEPKPRARAFAVYGVIGTLGAGVGLCMGGVLTTYVNWRWTLYVNTPLGIIAGVLALVLVARDRGIAGQKSLSMDIPGAVLATSCVSCLVFGLVKGSERGWGSPAPMTLMVLSLGLFGAFLLVEKRSSNPLIPARLVADRSRAACYGAAVLAGAAVLGMFFFQSQYLQNVRGYSAVATGLAFMPNVVMIIIASKLAEKLLNHVGPAVVLVAGLVLAGCGVAMLGAFLTPTTGFLTRFLPSNLVLCLGLGLAFVTLASTTLHGVEHSEAGIASALFTACQQVGGAAGLAILATVAAGVTSGQSANPAQAATAGYAAGFYTAAGFFVAATLLVAVFVRVPRAAVEDEAHAMLVI